MKALKNINLKHQKALCYLLLLGCLSCINKDDFPDNTPVKVTAVYPESVLPGDTITIEGNGFKNERTTVVLFSGNLLGRVIEASSSRLKVVVPLKQDVKGTILVKTGANNYSNSPNDFIINPYPQPNLEKLSIKQGPQGTSLVAEGKYLSEILKESDKASDLNKTTVMVGGVQALVSRVSFSKIWFKIPENISDGAAEVTITRDGKMSNPVNFIVDKYYQIEDDFERPPHAEYLETNSLIRLERNWSIMSGKWKISSFNNNGVLESTTGTDITVVNKSVKTLINQENDFTISGLVHIKSTASNAWAGLAFNVQDSRNFYVLRINGIGTMQLIRIVNGAAGVIGLNSTARQSSLPGQNFYRLEVTATAPYTFSVRISDINGTEIFSQASLKDANNNFNNGYGGFYSTSGVGAYFDDLFIRSSVSGDE